MQRNISPFWLPTNTFLRARRYDETYSPEEFQNNISNAKKSRPVKKVESAKSTPAEAFAKLLALNKTKGPIPFRPTQRDYKRQEKLVSVDSLSKITFDDGVFKG